MSQTTARVFYSEQQVDRWLPYDRYPRAVIRRVVRGPKFSGYQRRLDSLRKGLEKIGISYTFNDFNALHREPGQAVGLLGNQSVLKTWTYPNPLLVGPSMLSHPLERPDLFDTFNAKLYLVAGPWIHKLFAKYWGDRVAIWPIGTDTDVWSDVSAEAKTTDFLVYEKFLWDRERNINDLYEPIVAELNRRGLTHQTLTCGFYNQNDYRRAVCCCRHMIYLSEHETQGQAVLEAMSSGVPIFAWDQGDWLDPIRLKWENQPVPASSVPYFEPRCGMTFRNLVDFQQCLEDFMTRPYQPRSYVLQNLTLEKSARQYVEYLRRVQELA